MKQRKIRQVEKKKLGTTTFLGLFFLMVLFGGAAREYKRRMWNGAGRMNIVSLGKNIEIQSIDPQTHEAIRVQLPPDLEIETQEGRGVWRLEVLPELAKKYGNKWLVDSIGGFLGVAMTADVKELSMYDRLIWWNMNRSANWRDVQLDKTAYVSQRIAADEVRVLGLDSRWNVQVRDYFSSSELELEGLDVKILNSTKSTGLGAYGARIVESAGIKVTSVDQNDTTVQKCELTFAPEQKNTKTVKFLADEFGCDTREGSELILKLGEDYAYKIKGKD